MKTPSYDTARQLCRTLGFVLRRSYGSEYRLVPVADPREALAYYTDSLEDAIGTAAFWNREAMAS